jgi:phospholipase/lecithinase/hemolysin
MTQDTAASSGEVIYAFGDSLSDAGNLSLATAATGSPEPVSPPYDAIQYGAATATVFSNGPVWVQDLAAATGAGALTPSLLGGTDFAYGGAETGLTPQNTNLGDAELQAISLPEQLTEFQAAVPHPVAGALYTLSVGANDILDILADSGLSAAQQTTDVNDAVANEISFVNQLVAGGARDLMVLDVPDLGKTPGITSGADGDGTPSAAFDTLASSLATEYNADLAGQLAVVASGNGIAVNIVDAYGLVDAAVANPAAYGLTNVTSPVWSGTYSSDASGTLATTDVAAQDQYLFWDQLHPTETGHQGLAALGEQALASGGVGAGLAVADITAGAALPSSAVSYIGPVSGLQAQYISVSPDNLDISAATPGWFIHSGAGNDAIAVSSGTNVIDGGTGSNFLTGGSGTDTFFVDDRGPAAAIWSTLNGFHAGDAATIWGLTPGDFTLSWVDGQGAAGYTGLTLHATEAAGPTASLTLSGYGMADLTDGRLSTSYGTVGGANYLYVHANS